MDRLTVDTKEIMQLTQWGRDFVRLLVKNGTLPNVGTQKRILVPRKALQDYLERPRSQ